MKIAEAAEARQRSSGLFNKILLGRALESFNFTDLMQEEKSYSLFT